MLYFQRFTQLYSRHKSNVFSLSRKFIIVNANNDSSYFFFKNESSVPDVTRDTCNVNFSTAACFQA